MFIFKVDCKFWNSEYQCVFFGILFMRRWHGFLCNHIKYLAILS